MKNESYWEEIETLDCFKQTSNQTNYDECWAMLEKFQVAAGPKLNSLCLIILVQLLRHVYSAGYSKGHAAAEYNDTGTGR